MKTFRQFNNLIEAPETKPENTTASSGERIVGGDQIEKTNKKLRDKYIRQQAKKGNTTPSELKKRFKGASYDDEPFSKTQRKFDTQYTKKGELKTSPSFFDKRQEFQIGDDGRPSKEAVKQRLKGRIASQSKRLLKKGNEIEPKSAADIANKKKLIDKGERYAGTDSGRKRLDKLVDRVAKNQKLDTKKGVDSSLYKTLKQYSDVTNPTVKGKSGGKLPMPNKTKSQKKAFDDIVKKGKDKFFNTNKKFGNVGREFDLQFKADKLRLDAGGRIAQKDPKYKGMKVADKKANILKIKADIDAKNPTIKTLDGKGYIPDTKANRNQLTKNTSTQTPSSSKPLKSLKDFLKNAVKSKALRKGAMRTATGVSKAAPIVTGTFNAIGNYKAARAQGRSKLSSAVKSAVTTAAYIGGAAAGGTLGTGAGAITGPGALVTGTAGAVIGGSTASKLTSTAYDKIFKPPTKKKVKTGIKNSPSVPPVGGTNPSYRRWSGGIAIES